MVTTRSTPRNQTDDQKNNLTGGQNDNNPSGDNTGEVPAHYARREERMTEGVIGGKKYPELYAFDDVDPLSNLSLFARASWLDTDALNEDNFCDRYATNGYLPGEVLLHALQTVAWQTYFSCADRYLIVCHGKTLQGQREAFTGTILTSLSKYFRSPTEVPDWFEMDLFWYRNRGEMELARNLTEVTEEQLNAWLIP